MDYAFSLPKGTILDTKLILHFHYLLKRSSYPLEAGTLKTEPNLVTETQEDGSKKMLFVPPLPSLQGTKRKNALCQKAFHDGEKAVGEIIANSLIPLFKSEIGDYIPDVSLTTIELALSTLQKEGKIIKIGAYRNAKYIGKAKAH